MVVTLTGQHHTGMRGLRPGEPPDSGPESGPAATGLEARDGAGGSGQDIGGRAEDGASAKCDGAPIAPSPGDGTAARRARIERNLHLVHSSLGPFPAQQGGQPGTPAQPAGPHAAGAGPALQSLSSPCEVRTTPQLNQAPSPPEWLHRQVQLSGSGLRVSSEAPTSRGSPPRGREQHMFDFLKERCLALSNCTTPENTLEQITNRMRTTRFTDSGLSIILKLH